MPEIIFVSATGDRRTVTAQVGTSVMQVAVGAGVPGIDADCGGSCSCATCHVLVDAAWFYRLPVAGENERDMLEFAVDPQPQSRLSCQIQVTEELDGLIVHTPVTQR